MQCDLESLPIEIVCGRQWRRCVEVSRAQFRELPREQVLEIRYESLGGIDVAVRRLCEYAGISDVDRALDYHARKVRPVSFEEWRASKSAELAGLVMEEFRDTIIPLEYAKSAGEAAST